MKRSIIILAALLIVLPAFGQDGYDLDDALAYWSCDDGGDIATSETALV
jgi:hypothetical protein